MAAARYQLTTQKQFRVANNISCLLLKVQTSAHLHSVALDCRTCELRVSSVVPGVPPVQPPNPACHYNLLSAYFNDLEIVSRGQASVNIF